MEKHSKVILPPAKFGAVNNYRIHEAVGAKVLKFCNIFVSHSFPLSPIKIALDRSCEKAMIHCQALSHDHPGHCVRQTLSDVIRIGQCVVSSRNLASCAVLIKHKNTVRR